MKSHLHNNRLLKHDSNQANAVYTYDAHGNMLTMPHLPTMEWDSVDHLHKSVRGNDTTWYKYDTEGNRRRKITDKPGGIKEERIYHGDYELYRKYVNDVLQEETRTVHVSDGERRIATVDYKTVENGVAITSYNDIVRYQYDNHLGSACLELDANALTITYEEYHPFGTSSYKLADNDTEVKRKRYRYVGKERDEETGLYYYGARYYAAWIARFISVDPMANQRTWVSPYNYCQNNPINRIDPNGALDDGFTVDQKGYIERVNNTGGDKYDVLYTKEDYLKAKQVAKENGTKNEYGNPEPDKKLKIYDKTILPYLMNTDTKFKQDDYFEKRIKHTTFYPKTKQSIVTWDVKMYQGHYAISNNSECKKLFDFVHSNTDVEWALTKNKFGQWAIGTLHKNGQAPVFQFFTGNYSEYGRPINIDINGFEIKNLIYEGHSHSGTNENNDFKPSPEDEIRANNLRKENSNIIFELFMPNNPKRKKINY